MFADDTNLTASGDSITDLEAAVNSDLENLRKWLIANKLSLNVAKTEFILIGSKPMIKNISGSHPNIFIENEKIKQVYECKTLGVTIDQPLSNWKSNTETRNTCMQQPLALVSKQLYFPNMKYLKIVVIFTLSIFLQKNVKIMKKL